VDSHTRSGGRRQRGVTVARRYIQNALAGAHVHGLGQRLADDLQRRAAITA